jgi:hypothetical protein
MQLVDEIQTIHELKCHYIRGHQNLKKKPNDFTLPELYNVAADAEATIMRFQMPQPAARGILFTTSIVNIYVCHQLIGSSLNTILHEAFTRDA